MSDPQKMLPILLAIFGAFLTFAFLQNQRNSPPFHRINDDVPLPDNLEPHFSKQQMERVVSGGEDELHQMIRPYFWPWHERVYSVTNPDLTWETVQLEYTDMLQSFHFLQDRGDLEIVSTIDEKYERVELMVWRRQRFFGMEGEQIGVAWIEDGENQPQVVIFFGSDR